MNTAASHAFCQSTKANGEPCRAHPVDHSAYCFTHNPASDKRRRAARRAGGVARNRKAVLDPKDAPDIPLNTPTQIVAFLTSTIHQLRRGEIDPSLGRVLCSLTNTLLKAIAMAYQEPFSPLGDILLRNNLIYDAKARDADDERMARREAERQAQEGEESQMNEEGFEDRIDEDDPYAGKREEEEGDGQPKKDDEDEEKDEDEDKPDISEDVTNEPPATATAVAPLSAVHPPDAVASGSVIPDPPSPPPPVPLPKMEGFCLHTLAACTRPRRDGAFDVEIEFEAERFIRNFQGELVPAPLCHRIDVIVYGIPEEGKPDGAVVGRPRVPIYTSRSRHVFSVPIRPYKTAIYCTPDGPLTLEFKQLELKEMNPSWF